MRKFWLLLLLLPLCAGMDGGFPQFGMPVSYSGGGTASPILFQHIASSTNPVGNGITGHAFVIQTEAVPANTVAVLFASVPVAASTFSISDTLVGTWPAATCTATGGTGNYKAGVFVEALGATGGADTITINIGTTSRQPVQYDLTLWQNVNTSTLTGGSLCTASGGITANSSGLLSPGSFTPTNNNSNGGNVIETYYGICGSAGSNSSNWTAASGFSLLSGEIIWITDQGFPNAVQYEVQTTDASVTPSITATGETATGDCFNSASVALPVANNSATAPSTIHVIGIFHESFASFSSPGTMKVQIPFKGNLRVVGFTWQGDSPGGGAGYISAITSSDACNFTDEGHSSGGATIWYAQNCSSCPTCTVSLTWTGTYSSPQGSFRIYDIENAAASSFQNFTSGGVISCSTSGTGAPSFTPTGASSGLTIHQLGNGDGPITAITAPSGAAFDLWTFTGQTDSDLADNADASDHYYYSSTAAQNWSFTKTHGSDSCYPAAAAFN